MSQSDTKTEIEALERAFWQSMVDDTSDVATGMLTEPALMVSGHGAMSFDHAGYTKMAENAKYRILDYALSDFDVLSPGEDVAIATYRVHQKMEMDGKPVEMDAVDSSTWIRTGGQWKCAVHTESQAQAKD